jgi:hypothetical protein
MKLPNAHRAVVPREKIVDYLLDTSHPDGGSKAAFFQRAGFRRDNWMQMAAAFLRHGQDNEIAREEEAIQGRKFIVEAPMLMPAGQRPWIRSVWIILSAEDAPRFVSAYPIDSPHD